MAERSGFFAVGTLVIVLIFFGLRGFDEKGRFNPLREPPAARVISGDGGPSRIVIEARRNGHFMLDAEIGGRKTSMLIDSGASLVTLRESDALKAGIRVRSDDYRLPFTTANGTVLGAPQTLPALMIGDILLEDLAIIILPDRLLAESLFGVNGLNRFARREVTPEEYILFTD